MDAQELAANTEVSSLTRKMLYILLFILNPLQIFCLQPLFLQDAK